LTIDAVHLTTRYDETIAVDDLSFIAAAVQVTVRSRRGPL